MSIQNILNWFAGGENGYMTLYHCMAHDNLWVGITVALDIAVAGGYVLITKHWWQNERTLPDIPAKRALRSMRNIFLLCGICGYLFIPIKMFWPAWRLYDMVMVVLVYVTWKYAWGARDLKVVYNEIGRNTQLADDLEKSREEGRRKSFFLNAISHDLRTPLNAIILQTHLADLTLANKDDAALGRAMSDIRSSAKSTADLLNTLLEYARLDWASEPPTPARVRLADVVEEALAAQRATADVRGLTLRSNVPANVTVCAHRAGLERVLSNLVNNAIKFTTTGGVRVEMDASGDAVELHVIDTGIGIDPAALEGLFGEFVQLENSERDRTKGFGLGLTISRRLARQWGGDVTATSGKGVGSRFTILIPGAKAMTGADPDNAAADPVAALA